MRDAKCFYDLQKRAVENVRVETYSLLIETYDEEVERDRLLRMTTSPAEPPKA